MLDMHYKWWLSIFAIVLTFISFVPYVRSIYQGDTKPHFFSWLIWALTTTIIFFAQREDDGGVGTWSIGLSGIITGWVAWIAFKRSGMGVVTTLDWIFLVGSLLSLPLWYLTASPLWSVIILTSIDTLGFGPTIRKAFKRPNEENVTFYWLFIFRNVLVIFSLENYSTITMLFPIVMSVGCLILLSVILIRKKQLA